MIRLSLIIPTHNRSERLIAALESVIRQDLPAADWECVVVSNNSTDDTVARFGDFAARYPGLNLRLVTEDGPGVSYARNRGIAETSAPLLVFIDDDERINPGFLRAYADFFDAHPDAVVAGGRIIAEYVTGRPAWLSKYTEMPIANPMDFGDAVRPFPAGRVPGGGNMAFRRSAALRYGGFDPSLGRVGRMLIGGEENDFFETPAYLFTIVENDEIARPLVIDSKRLKEQMYKDEKVVANTSKKKSKKDDGTLVIDLHADEVLETTAGMNSADILHYQMDIFKKTMEEYKKKKGQKIIFIHGKGEGVLRQTLIHELNYRYKSCTYQDASFQEYGYGATQVTIK